LPNNEDIPPNPSLPRSKFFIKFNMIWFYFLLDPVKGSTQIWSAKVQVFVHGVVYDVVYDAVNDIVCYVGWNMDNSVGKKVCDTMGGIIRVDMGDMIGE
jgi:hypothetical protein